MTVAQQCDANPDAGRALRYFLRALHHVDLISGKAWSRAWEASYGFRLSDT